MYITQINRVSCVEHTLFFIIITTNICLLICNVLYFILVQIKIVFIFIGSFGDNELSPECLDGAQRFLKQNGICIPASYTSFLAPLQCTKIYNEIRTSRPADKSLESCYETPYVVHLVNYYQIAVSQVSIYANIGNEIINFLKLEGEANTTHVWRFSLQCQFPSVKVKVFN